eukprot:TRINITY_DN6483_c0_g2_i1.p1 TRINITY_DN6483_c0_g2~~TRINITY_DN6483_c0_g2_i1.p1  ORF type:complete len:216 (+),score=9.56 TRINITY_DN6483_c0_g2_i1:462-1109(+)
MSLVILYRKNNRNDVDEELERITKFLLSIPSLEEICFDFENSGVTDQGCKTIARLLHHSRQISRVKLYLQNTMVSDLGCYSLLSRLPFLPIQTLSLAFQKNLTDRSIGFISSTLRRIPRLAEYIMFCSQNDVSETSFISLLDSLAYLPVLTRLDLIIVVQGITNKFCDKIADLIVSRPNITRFVFFTRRTGVTLEALYKLRDLKATRHTRFYIHI